MGSKLDAPAPEFTTLADNFEGKKFNSPNDLHIASDGKIYFTDPPYGLSSSEAKELDFCGVYVIDTTGEVHLLVDSLTRPNGIALALDIP